MLSVIIVLLRRIDSGLLLHLLLYDVVLLRLFLPVPVPLLVLVPPPTIFVQQPTNKRR
jgi:hypothetical protein